MAGKSTRLTLQDISDKTGYGRSTVSLALRNHPSLADKTRKAIQEEARKMGYKPNPLVAALMAQLKGKRHDYQETVAVLVKSDNVARQMQDESSFYGMLYSAMKKKAADQGFEMDLFCVEQEQVSAERLTQILVSRGTHGILIFPGGSTTGDRTRMDLQLDWSYFATVLVGFNRNYKNFNQVVADYTHDIDLALQMLRKSDCRRVGFAVPESRNRGSDFNLVSRFLLYQQELPARSRLPFVQTKSNDFSQEEFLHWVHSNKPDTILIAGGESMDWLKAEGYRIPQDIRLINLVERGEPGLAGIDPRTTEVGSASVELLVSLLQSSQYGLPEYPKMIAIKGAWKPGPSFPE